MNYNLQKTESGEINLEVTISSEELSSESTWAAARLAKNLKLPGFRPGKIPYEIIKKELGEMAILEESADKLVADKLNEIIKKENLDLAAQPKIEVKKLAAGNEFIFTAALPLIPAVTLPNFTKIKIKTLEVKIEPSELDNILNNLRQTRVKETLTAKPAEKNDKIQLDLEIKVNSKVIEGGQAKKTALVLGETKLIPGIEEQLLGLKAGDEKEFNLDFPKNYVENLAGKTAEFKILVHAVYQRELPELTDDFAKNFGAKNLEDLKNQITENLRKEAGLKAEEKQELEIIENTLNKTQFGPVPSALVESEQEQILQEIKTEIEKNNGKFEDYLSHLKKTKDELSASFKANALKRVKTWLLFRQIIKENQFVPDKNLIDQELEKAQNLYSQQPEIIEKIRTETYRRYVESVVLNRQVINWLKGKIKIK